MERISLQTIIASEENRSLLLFLDGGPKRFEELIESLGKTEKQVFTNIELLRRWYLVTPENDVYRLTTLGELISEKLKPLLRIEEFMRAAEGYWLKINLDFIPPPLLKKLPHLNLCTVVRPNFHSIFDYNKDVHKKSLSSQSFFMVAAALHPNFADMYSDLIENGINILLIFDSSLFEKAKRDNHEWLQKIIKNERVSLYVCPEEMQLLSFKVTDSCLAMRLLSKDGTYDHKQLVCYTADAVDWGKELFEYYRQQSVLITDI
ncbi:MAG: winged helix-turn-helix domain-containing protein [Methanolobus sp.]|uniref:helix-turn-helix transcriptional regulator n=1 Tax=Methanolobus sp. TaxID=1874737 RepID=UPI00273091A7|nr:winged helix-turn-helix domain-containing protein [Methanolobus sp.]MDP2216411.1 winged helix-turn-helix domain-containing protein [Methanolobus sp.]